MTGKIGYECPHCGKAMFYLQYRPIVGQKAHASMVYVEEGKNKPRDGERIECQFCGKGLYGDDISTVPIRDYV